MIESFPMPNPESRVYILKPEDKLGGKSLGLAYPAWNDEKITGEEADKILASADFKGIITQKRPAVRYELTTKDGVKFAVAFDERIDPLLKRVAGYEFEARKVLEGSEEQLGDAPLTGVLWS